MVGEYALSGPDPLDGRTGVSLRFHHTAVARLPASPPQRAVRARSVATPMGASNLDAIIDEGTLTLGWVGPALLGILIAAFGWAGRVFEWLGTLATWLFSGKWRGGGEV